MSMTPPPCTEKNHSPPGVTVEQLCLSALEQSRDGFVALDAQWRFLHINAAAMRLLGIRKEEHLGKSLWGVFPLISGTEMEEKLRSAAMGESDNFDLFYEPLNKWLNYHYIPHENWGGGAV